MIISNLLGRKIKLHNAETVLTIVGILIDYRDTIWLMCENPYGEMTNISYPPYGKLLPEEKKEEEKHES